MFYILSSQTVMEEYYGVSTFVVETGNICLKISEENHHLISLVVILIDRKVDVLLYL